QAMKAAASSCRTRMKRMLSLRARNASMIPLMLSPGKPKTTSTPHSSKHSTSTSPAVIATSFRDTPQLHHLLELISTMPVQNVPFARRKVAGSALVRIPDLHYDFLMGVPKYHLPHFFG